MIIAILTVDIRNIPSYIKIQTVFTIADKMRLLVSGGREFDDVDFIVNRLNRLHNSRSITELVHGSARGVDTICGYWADEIAGVTPIPVPAKWRDEKGNYNPRAGFQRNQRMLTEYRPDALLAFPGGRGTADMVERANKVLQEVWQSNWIYFKKEDPDYGFMSNFAEGHGFFDDAGFWWETSEHYYQAMKSVIDEEQQYVRSAPDAFHAKKRGGEINITTDWSYRKITVMRKVLEYKFAKGTEAAGLLEATGIDYLVEWAPWGDVFWGVDKQKQGQNWLGRLLMEQREKL
jgi:ribA/ribD-fused uncharacterized protein